MIEIIDNFARGGGGGSGGGGGGGGGGSSGGGSGGLSSLPIIVGYYIGFGATQLARRIMKNHQLLASVVSNVAITALLIFCAVLSASGLMAYVIFLTIIGIWFGWYAAYHSFWKKFGKRVLRAKNMLEKANAKDASWSPQQLLAIAKDAFIRYQNDWTNGDYSRFSEYLHPAYEQKAAMLLIALKELGRKNDLSNIHIINMDFIDIKDNADNEKDVFAVYIEAKMHDVLIDNATGKQLFKDDSKFIEYWYFEREGQTWKVYDIKQDTANDKLAKKELESFAAANNMYYSVDMGWLYLPRRGTLLARGGFGVADINNHVIGNWAGHLVQVYSYSYSRNENPGMYLLVGQLNLPKSYDYILVRPKQKMLNFTFGLRANPPSEANKYTLEWPDFNHKFEVFATNQDRLASFELLNPGFMAFMYDINEEITLEVVDNIVYFFVKESINPDKYAKLLELLAKAYKELKL